MAEIINLNKFRKAKEKAERSAQAAENRAKFGRRKADREVAEAAERLATERLAGHKLGDEPESA